LGGGGFTMGPEGLPACCYEGLEVGEAVCSGGGSFRASFGGVIGIARLSSRGNGCIGSGFG
ncbi:40258_t:CDS:2, partial [Gigaspora margarita]